MLAELNGSEAGVARVRALAIWRRSQSALGAVKAFHALEFNLPQKPLQAHGGLNLYTM